MKFKVIFESSKANETSFQGYLETTFQQLIEKLGEPYYPNSGDGKVICEWILEFEDNTIATIYCWKVKDVPIGLYKWHIGGKSSKAIKYVKMALGSKENL
jgi:hypothetical protein